MSVFYRKYQNKNPHGSSYGKWFARAVTIGKTVNVDELARHMSEHNTPYSKGAIKGVLTDMIGCIRELMLEGKSVKLDGLAIFSAGIKTKKKGAPTSEDFSTTKHIDSVYMRARATGEFTRAELTKAGNVTELPKNYTDYHEEDEDDEPQNPSGGNGSSQNGGSQNSGDSGSQSGDSGSSGDSGQSQQSTYGLTINRSGSGTSTVTDDSEQAIDKLIRNFIIQHRILIAIRLRPNRTIQPMILVRLQTLQKILVGKIFGNYLRTAKTLRQAFQKMQM